MNDISEIFLIYIVGILLVLYIIFTACIIIKYKILDSLTTKKIKKEKSYAQKLIPIIIIAILSYTVISFILQFKTGTEPSSTLTTCFFSFFAIELVNLAAIKVKEKRESSIEPLSEDEFKDDFNENVEG